MSEQTTTVETVTVSILLTLHCEPCQAWYELPIEWPVDRDPREAHDDYAEYVLPCGHGSDPELIGVNWAQLPDVRLSRARAEHEGPRGRLHRSSAGRS